MMRLLLMLAFAAISLQACEAQPSPTGRGEAAKTPRATLATPDNFEELLADRGTQLIDVRTPGEYKAGHLKGATLADISQWKSFRAVVSKLDPTRPVLVYCAVGGRSAQAAAYLTENGYANVVDLQGGIKAWSNQGKSIEKN
jgi:rhodanese-related sulfurtransferase